MRVEEELQTASTPIVLVLCISGSIGHVITIVLLYSMRNPTNTLLISMSCSQLALCVNFLYSTLFKYFSDVQCVSTLWSKAWMSTLLISVNLSVVVHVSGIFHVVALSIIRYISLTQLVRIHSARPWFDYDKCFRSILIINACVLVICTPFFFNSEVRAVAHHETCSERFPILSNITYHELGFTQLAITTILGQFNFWLFGTICKLIPGLILVIMSIFIVKKLNKLQGLSARFTSISRERQHRRVTKIILVIMVMVVVIEMPQGILALMSSLSLIEISGNFGDAIEILSLTNSCIIFALFCSMNSRIRQAFAQTTYYLWNRRLPKSVRREESALIGGKNSKCLIIKPSENKVIYADDNCTL